jgi:surface antigen
MGRVSAAMTWALAILLGLLTFQPTSATQYDTVPEPLYRGLNARDLEAAHQTVQRALESGPSHSTERWKVPASGSSGKVTPLRTFRIASGYYCREFRETVVTNARKATANRVACRTEAGLWLRILD